jgi:threonine dehydrogenase-like Zn-dependent dehydrogenase
MKATRVVAPGEAVFVDVEPPSWQPGHALVRPLKLSLCGSDIRMLCHAAPNEYPFPPGTTGHEMVGVVEQVDSDAPIRPGDLTLTLAPGHGAMCSLYSAPLEHVLPLPSGKPIEQLLQAQQLGTVIYACQRLPNVIGKDVAVIGQGSAGLWFCFQLKRMGARRIVAIDLEMARLGLSHHFGATHTVLNNGRDVLSAVHEITEGRLVDLVVEAAGELSAINLAVDLVRKFGQILFFGCPRGQILEFNFEQFFFKCCQATTIVGAAEEPGQISTRTALQMIAQGEIDVQPMLTHCFPFERVMEAYELQRTRADGAIKIIVDMGP